ncbi:MAG: Spy/CpxP family protein refolding chaperone [Janthinobacterium lividum]
MLKTIMRTGVVAGLLAAGAVQAQGMHPGMHGGMNHGYLGFLQGVTLSDAQQAKMHDIMHASWQQLKSQMQQLRALREQIGGNLASTASISAAQLAALQQQAQTLRNQLDQAKLATAMQVRALLTPDQLSRSATVHAQLAALHQQEHAVMSQTPAAAAQ